MRLLNAIEDPRTFKRRLIISICAVIVFIMIVQIWVANRLSTYGEEINNLEKSRFTLELENQYLRNQISEKLSLQETKKDSQKIGLLKAKNVEYITSSSKGLAENHNP